MPRRFSFPFPDPEPGVAVTRWDSSSLLKRHPPPAALRTNPIAWIAAHDLITAVRVADAHEPDRPMWDAHETLRALVTQGHAAACREFNYRFAKTQGAMPFLHSNPHGLSWWTLGTAVRGVQVGTVLPLPLAMWLVLSESGVWRRIHECKGCHFLFLDETGRRTCYCSKRCANLISSRDHRAAGKERERRARQRAQRARSS